MTKQSVEMRLTLVGERADVSAVMLMAAESGLLKSMSVIEQSKNGTTPQPVQTPTRKSTKYPPSRSKPRPYNPGERVVVVANRQGKYPDAAIGHTGVVVATSKRAKGYSIRVRWDDTHQESVVASSIIKTR